MDKLEVTATKEEWIQFIDQLQKGDRLISATAWDHQWMDEKKPAAGIIYLKTYYYQDSKGKIEGMAYMMTIPNTTIERIQRLCSLFYHEIYHLFSIKLC